MTVLGHKA